MKTPTVALLLSLFASTLAWTQEDPPRVRRIPIPPGGSGAPAEHTQKAPPQSARAALRAAGVPASRSPGAATLGENISVGLSGSVAEELAMEITLSGCGQLLQADTILGFAEIADQRIPIIGKVSYRLERNEAGYLVNYDIGIRSPIPTNIAGGGDKKVHASVSFQEVSMTGMARCKPGEAVEIFRSGEHSLRLVVGAVKPAKGPRKAEPKRVEPGDPPPKRKTE